MNPSLPTHAFLKPQKLASCFADKSKDCRGKGVNLFRLWILREAQLEAKLGICPKVNFKNLEESVENTGNVKRDFKMIYKN